MNSKDVYISNGKRPLWHNILAAFFFTACVFIGYLVFFENKIERLNKEEGGLAYLFFFLFMFGIRFSQVIDYEFNFENMEYKKIYVFGVLKFSFRFPFQKLKYVAVFDKGGEVYEINLWHGKNKRFLISLYEEPKGALRNARYIAEKLSLDVWDATDPHNGHWMDMDGMLELD